MGGQAALEPQQPLVVAEHRQVATGDVGGVALGQRGDLGGLGRRGQLEAGAEALLHRRVAAGPAENEGDGREQAGRVQPGDDVGAPGDPEPGRPAPAAARPARCPPRRPLLALGDAQQLRVDRHRAGPAIVPGRPARPARRARPAGPAVGGEQVIEAPAGQHVLPERHRPVLVDDHCGAAADLGQPVAELLRIADRRGQRHQPHGFRQVDDHLFPDRAAEPVGQIVHLVEHDIAERGQRRRARVEHVAQHLGGHHDHWRLAVNAVITGEQADAVRGVAADQVRVFLVGQGLDRRGVEALAALGQSQVHGELTDHRLARSRWRGEQDPVTGVQRPAGADLEVVELEVIESPERGELRPVLGLAPAGGGIAVRGAHRGTHAIKSRRGGPARR